VNGKRENPLFTMGAFLCGTFSLLLMMGAYKRAMFPPPGWYMGDPELEILAGLMAFVGLLLCPFARWKWIPATMCLLALLAIAASLAGAVLFGINFPARIGPPR